MYTKTRLKSRVVKEALVMYPTISTLDELLALKGIERKNVSQQELDAAEVMIERNRLRLQVSLKQELYQKNDQKSKELLYKMICDTSELKRFGVKETGSDSKSMTIEIKSADPGVIDKVKEL